MEVARHGVSGQWNLGPPKMLPFGDEEASVIGAPIFTLSSKMRLLMFI